MKDQTAVLLLCFLSGVFLSVVQAKPSPALMRELVSLEKYLEKKEGSEGTDGQNKNQGDTPTDKESQNKFNDFPNQNTEKNDEPQNIGQEGEIKPIDEQDKTKNENNNNGGKNTAEGSDPEAGENDTPTGPTKPEDAPPQNAEEDSGPSENGEEAPHKEEGSPDSGVNEEGNLPKEGNKLNPSEGQVENGRDQIYKRLDEITRNIKDALDKLSQLGESFRVQFQNDDRKFTELENNDKKAKEKTIEKIGQLKTLLEEIKRSTVGLDETPSVGKESVRENAPARRSHISDTEFLNMLHSLLTYS